MHTEVVPVAVPATPGTGEVADISSLVGEKTVQLSGTFSGYYVLYVSHDGTHWAPVASFTSGSEEEIQTTFAGSFRYARVVSRATSLGSSVQMYISGLEDVGGNSFATMLVPAGFTGTTAAIDLGLTNFQQDLNFILQGAFAGTIVVEGSLDGVVYNPIGSLSTPPSANNQQSLEFSPLVFADKVRYVRVTVLELTTTEVSLSVGGRRDAQLTTLQQLVVEEVAAERSVSITDYGADRTGHEFSDDAIEEAILVAKASQTRRLVYCPPGTYKISKSIVIRQANGLSFLGAGTDATKFMVSGVVAGPALDLNGVTACTVGGFTIYGDTGYAGPTTFESGVRYWWDGTGQTSSGNTFRDLYVHTGKFKVGIQVGSDESLHNFGQEDQTFWYSVRCVGPGIAGFYDPTWWQDGIRVGSGVHGNNLIHNFYGIISSGFQNGVREDAGEAVFIGGCVQSNKVDWLLSGTGPASKYWKVCGMRSENSERFISTAGSSIIASQVSFENCEFACVAGYVAADRYVVNYPIGGVLNLRNITIANIVPSYKPRILYGGQCLNVEGMTVCYGDPSDLFDLTGQGCAVVAGVICTDGQGIPVDATSFGDGVRVLSATGRGLGISYRGGAADVGVDREGGAGPGALLLNSANGVMPFGSSGPRWLYGASTAVATSPQVGDVVWNSAPASGGYVGWTYTATGWQGFGLVA